MDNKMAGCRSRGHPGEVNFCRSLYGTLSSIIQKTTVMITLLYFHGRLFPWC